MRQERDKIIEKGDDFNPLVKVALVKTRIGVIELDKKITIDDEDWFKELTIRVHNISDKPVTFVSVELRFRRPQYQSKEPDLLVPLVYGINPFDPPAKNLSPPPSPILPKETANITLADTNYNSIRTMLSELNYPPNINAIKVGIRSVGFADGTTWVSGRIFKRDPNDPEKWTPEH
jgi:hypothetical protein